LGDCTKKIISNSSSFARSGLVRIWIIACLDFLKNNALLGQLIQIKGAKVMLTEQVQVIQTLTSKHILHHEMMRNHFDTFIKMKDKEKVAQNMSTFLSCASYLGFTDFDETKLIQIYRRIYKEPENCKMEELLDLLLLVALKGSLIIDYDEKSIKFVRDALEYVDT